MALPLPQLEDNFSRFTLKALLDDLRVWCGHEHAAGYRVMMLIQELDRRDDFDGRPMDIVGWLVHNCGITHGAAREKVRSARALVGLPRIDEAFRDGKLSYSKVRAVTRVANASNEADLLDSL